MSDQLSADGLSDSNPEITGPKLTDFESKAHDLMTKGRQLNLDSKFDQKAFDLLSRAIKLNPYLIDAWIELTKCYQKKSDTDGAIACLESALKFSDKPNKIILRQLSTCIRQKNCDSQESKIAALLRSLELSKLALRADLNDEENYYNLAKAYMCLFFVTECVDQQLINLSRAAYSKALSLSNENRAKKLQSVNNDSGDDLNKSMANLGLKEETKPFIEQSDFLFNFSTVLVYFQEFDKALEYLKIAKDLDHEWTEPKALEECLIDYLKQINSMLNEFGRNQKKISKKYGKIVESLKSVNKIEVEIQSDQRRLLQSQDVKVKSFTLNELGGTQDSCETRVNTDEAKPRKDNKIVRLLHLKLINAINYNQAMYLTFIAIDQNYSMIVVTIYNLAASRCPTSKDILTLVDPKIESMHVEHSNAEGEKINITYKRIDAREFKEFYVNGHRISTDQVSKPQFRISVLP